MGCILQGGEEMTYRPHLTQEQQDLQNALLGWMGTRYGSMATPFEGPLTAPIPQGFEEAHNIYRGMAGLDPTQYMQQPMTGYHTTFPGFDIDKPVREAWDITDEGNGGNGGGGGNGGENGGGKNGDDEEEKKKAY